MADTLSELQICLDQLNTQLYASLRYISIHHSASPLPNPSTTDPSLALTNGQLQALSPPQLDPTDILPPDHHADEPAAFAAVQKELAHDLVIKSKQVEELVRVLPGVERGREEQEERIQDLETELQAAMKEREEVEGERRGWVERVEELIVGVRR